MATVHKWLGRYLAHGEGALRDRSSRPLLSPRAIAPAKALAIVELRRQRLTQARIAASLGVSKSTVGRVLERAGLSHLKNLEPVAPVLRYEHAAAGDLLHIDTKRLGRIVRPGHRATGDRSGPFGSAGLEFVFVCIDDHARIGFTDMYPDEGKLSAVQFLRNAVAYYRSRGIEVKALLTDNASAFRSKDFAQACTDLNVKHALLDPIARKPMEKPSASSRRRCASGPTASSIKIPSSAPISSMLGFITTIDTALT